MKKILATVLALTMIVGMSIVPAFAANYAALGDTDAEIEVNATYVTQDDTEDETPVYSVDITWGDISFTYTASSNKLGWNTTSLKYDVDTGDNAASWSGDDAIISIVNKSNAEITVTAEWNAEADVDAAPVISGPAIVASADNGEGENGAGLAKNGSITVSKPVSGSITEDTLLGTITLSIA